MNIGFEDDELKPYVEPSPDTLDPLRIGNESESKSDILYYYYTSNLVLWYSYYCQDVVVICCAIICLLCVHMYTSTLKILLHPV